MMKLTLAACLTLIIALTFTCDMYSQDASPPDHSLVIAKTNSDKYIQVNTGSRLKIWHGKHSINKGVLTEIAGDSLCLSFANQEQWVLLSEIKKIKTYKQSGAKFVGATLILLGTAGLFLGGVGLVAGVAALIAEDLGAIILVAVPFLGGGGYGLLKAGEAIHGKKVRLGRRWTIQ